MFGKSKLMAFTVMLVIAHSGIANATGGCMGINVCNTFKTLCFSQYDRSKKQIGQGTEGAPGVANTGSPSAIACNESWGKLELVAQYDYGFLTKCRQGLKGGSDDPNTCDAPYEMCVKVAEQCSGSPQHSGS